jgi:hypothetical protein
VNLDFSDSCILCFPLAESIKVGQRQFRACSDRSTPSQHNFPVPIVSGPHPSRDAGPFQRLFAACVVNSKENRRRSVFFRVGTPSNAMNIPCRSRGRCTRHS